jgi:hypothetical protein
MKLGRVVLISAAGAAVIAGAATLLFFNGSEYRECVALMWDRKHPVQVRRRLIEMAAEKCEKDRLSNGFTNCESWRSLCVTDRVSPGKQHQPDAKKAEAVLNSLVPSAPRTNAQLDRRSGDAAAGPQRRTIGCQDTSADHQ